MGKNNKVRILIIDDEEWICDLLQDFLEGEGFLVQVAKDLGEGHEKLIAHALPDLLVLDVMLPDGNGMDYLKELRQTKRTINLPIIMITAHRIQVQDKIEGFNRGADDYLIKPFDLREFRSRVDRLLRRVERNKEFEKKQEPNKPAPIENHQSAHRAGEEISKMFKPPASAEKPRSARARESVSSISRKPPSLISNHSPRFSLSNIARNMVDLLLRPKSIFQIWIRRQDPYLVGSIFVILGLGFGIQVGSENKSWTTCLVGIVVFSGFALGLTYFFGWIIQWAMGLRQKSVSIKKLSWTLGLSWTPMALSALLGAIYVILAKGQMGEFTVGPLLLFPTQGTPSLLGVLLRHIDAFEIWTLILIVRGLTHVMGFKRGRTIRWVFGLWIVVITGLGFIKGVI